MKKKAVSNSQKKDGSTPPSSAKKSTPKNSKKHIPSQVEEQTPPPVEEEWPDIASDICTVDESTVESPVLQEASEDNKGKTMALFKTHQTTSSSVDKRRSFLVRKKTTEMYCGKKELDLIPDEVFWYSELRVLWLNENKIGKIHRPFVTEFNPQKDSLMLSNTLEYEYSFSQAALAKNLQRRKFEGLVYLTELYLHKNNLKSINDSGIRHLKHLKILSLHTNLMKDLSSVLSNFQGLHIEKLDLFGNPCSKEENYKVRVLETLGRSLKVLDRNTLTPSDYCALTGDASSNVQTNVIFGKTYRSPIRNQERILCQSTSTKQLEERCRLIREQRTAATQEKEMRKNTKREEAFRKMVQDAIPQDDPEENLYDEIRAEHEARINNHSAKQVTRKDYLTTFWTGSSQVHLN